jgi:maltose alpha-D-glucosyltransferase/alpha-amylase
MAEKLRQQFERLLAPPFIARSRWYASKGEAIERAQIVESAVFEHERRSWLLGVIELHGPAEPSRYFMPLAMAFEDTDDERVRQVTPGALAKVRQQAMVGLMGDALHDEAFCVALVAAIGARRELKAGDKQIRFVPTEAFTSHVGGRELSAFTPVRPLTMSSNSVALLADSLFLKLYRRLREGLNPEVEVGRFLTDVAKFPHAVPVLGSVELVDPQAGSTTTLALLQSCVVNQGDAWTFTVDALVRQLDLLRSSAEATGEHDGIVPLVPVLARRTAELHAALAVRTGDPAFDPEPVQPNEVAHWVRQVGDDARATLDMLASQRERLSAVLQPYADALVLALPQLLQLIDGLVHHAPHGLVKTRYHGDYHLGQLLVSQNDFFIIDFEGEPGRTMAERRRKHLALRDVAGMLRSFDYARHAAMLQVAAAEPGLERIPKAAEAWLDGVRRSFLESYREAAVEAGLYASAADFDAQAPLLLLFELEKALYELRYELNNRPDWVAVPLQGVAALIESTPAA